MKNKIWVLSHHRTGSGFFCEILGNILCLDLREFLAPWKFDFDYIRTGRKFFWSEPIDMRNIKLPNSSKIHYDTLKMMFGNFNSFKEKIGDAYFIKTSRRDVVSHAVSLYMAICLNKWRIESLSDKEVNWDNKQIQINDRNLIRCYNYILNINKCWDCVDVPFINVYYEDLIKNPVEEIKKVLNFLEIDFSDEQIKNCILASNKKIIKQTHPDKEKISIRLKKLIKSF